MKHYRTILLIIVAITMNSCATLLNDRHIKMNIKPDENIEIISVETNKGLQYSDRNQFLIDRDEDSVVVHYLNESIEKSLTLKPFKSNAFWWNIYFNYGIGMAIDENFRKSNAYLKNVYLTHDDFLVKEKKGVIKLTSASDLGFIIGHSDKYNYAGIDPIFYNINLGLEYYHKHNTFYSITAMVNPYLGGYSYDNNLRNFMVMLNTGISFRENHVFNNFEVGYGMSLNKRFINIGALNNNTILGFSFIGSNQMSKSFGVSFLYEPSYYNFSLMSFEYAHNFKFQVRFKINIK